MRRIKIFLSGPNDTEIEMKAVEAAIKDWNANHSDTYDTVFTTSDWKTQSSSQMGSHPQEIINEQVLKTCDYIFVIFKFRFGSKTNKFGSGTEHEFEWFKKNRTHNAISVYFSTQTPPATATQYPKVVAFKKRIEAFGEGLYGNFLNETELQKGIDKRLSYIAKQLKALKDDNEKINKKLGDTKLEHLVDAMIVFDIKKTEYLIEASGNNWDKILELVKPLRFFAIYHGEIAANPLLHVCTAIIYQSKFGLPPELSYCVEEIIMELLPIKGGLVGKHERPKLVLLDNELELFRDASRLGFELVYLGSRYLKSEDVVRHGCSVLWTILRYGILNKNQDLIKMSEEHFIDQIQHAEKRFSEMIKREYEDAKDLRYI